VLVGLSRAHGGLVVFGSVRPKICSVSSNEGREIWNVGVTDKSFSSSSSESICDGGLGGGARKV
jgi:outer membrane protein assembly factor BamB